MRRLTQKIKGTARLGAAWFPPIKPPLAGLPRTAKKKRRNDADRADLCCAGHTPWQRASPNESLARLLLYFNFQGISMARG
jgi:hypothetical protein